MELIPPSAQPDFLIYAFRYALGRQSCAVAAVQRVIKESWANLGTRDQQLIRREIREAQKKAKMGSPYDAIGWTEIMVLK